MTIQTKEPIDQVNIRMPSWLKRKAKAQAVLTDRSLQEVVRELLEKWLEEQQKEASHEQANR